MSSTPDRGTAAAPSEEIEALRARHGVRLVGPSEEGAAIERLPAGVFGFCYAPGQQQIPVFAQRSYHSFELHKAADGTCYLLGFVTDQEAPEIESGREGAAITLFPDPWENSRRLVSIRLAHIHAPMRVLPRQDGNPFPFTLS